MKNLKKFFVMGCMAIFSLCISSCGGSDSETLDSYQKIYEATGFQERINLKIQNGETPQIVDYRSAEEYAEGHIAGAVNIPATNKNAGNEFIKEVKARFTTDKSIYLYGSKTSNNTMGFYLAGLVSKEGWGISKTVQLMNGYESWVEAGLPVEK